MRRGLSRDEAPVYRGARDGRERARRARRQRRAATAPEYERPRGFSRLFGRSLKLRQVSAGGCNACELELNAVANVNFDLQRFGIEWVASPRHADALVITGTLTRTMRTRFGSPGTPSPSRASWSPSARCAISGGLYEGAAGVDRTFLSEIGPRSSCPGCPAPSPDLRERDPGPARRPLTPRYLLQTSRRLLPADSSPRNVNSVGMTPPNPWKVTTTTGASSPRSFSAMVCT